MHISQPSNCTFRHLLQKNTFAHVPKEVCTRLFTTVPLKIAKRNGNRPSVQQKELNKT